MERKIEYHGNSNGSYTKTTVTTTTPQDGFVSQHDINPTGIDNYGKYQMGYSKSIHMETDDPRVTIPFLIGITGIFQLIAIVMVIVGIRAGALENPSMAVGGGIFVLFVVFFTFAEIKEIKNILKKHKEKMNNMNNNGNYKG